jgi:acyl-CoA thioesterase FadM
MFAQSITVHPQFHKSIAQDWPIVMKTDITEIGKTSFTLRNQIVDGDDGSGEIFAESKNRVVCVDMASRKSTPLLPEFHALHAEYAKKIGDAGKFPTFDAPQLDNAQNVTKMQTTMRHSDQDFLFHTNQGVYFRLSQDCVCIAAEAGTLKQFDKDMCFYPIQQADALHKGESFPGDDLVTYCWEDPVLEMTMNFIVKKQEKEIFYARLKYYNENGGAFNFLDHLHQ